MKPADDSEEALFREALKRAKGPEREAYLDQACAGNAALRARLAALLKAHESPDPFLEPPAARSDNGTALPPPGESPGSAIGRYRLVRRLGEGGMGTVWEAEQEEPIRRLVALKVIRPGMDSKQVLARFEAERQALALMDHLNIAKVLDAGATETGRPFFVMELVRGTKITDYCDQNDLPIRQRLALFIQVCRAIQHAHQKGIIHRDIKPSNILVADQDGAPVPKVIDFGIAKAVAGQQPTPETLVTALGQLVGTPAYMSPEQARLNPLEIDTRSDIYSLGVLLYELLVGKTPFDPQRALQAGLDEFLRIIREEEPSRPSTRLSGLTPPEQTAVARHRQSEVPKLLGTIRGDLDWIVIRALEKDPARRFETANGLAADVQRYLNQETVLARPPSQLYRLQKLVRRNKLAFAATSAIAASLIAGFALFAWGFVERGRALSEVKRTLATSDFLQANHFIAENRYAEALSYLQRSVSLNPADPAAPTCLAILLSRRTYLMLPVVGFKHDSQVKSAQFSADGSRIVTASQDRTARVWDSQTGRPLTEPIIHGGAVALAEFSPDGKRILTISGRTARVWDAQTGQPLGEPFQHERPVLRAHFSPDGKRVLTLSTNTARVWDWQTSTPLTEPLRHPRTVTSGQFSPDGKHIVTACSDNAARLWDTQSGQLLVEPLKHSTNVFSKHAVPVLSVQFSPDGSKILTASDDTARLWDAQTGQPLGEPFKLDRWVRSAEFSPDGKRIVTAFGNSARVWDAETRQPLTAPLKHKPLADVFAAHFSPDGKRILTASWDQTARVWDAQTGQPLTEPLRHHGPLYSAQFSPDGQRILTVPMDTIIDEKRVVTGPWDSAAVVWRAQGITAIKFMRHAAPVLSAKFSPDFHRITTASLDKTARVWDAQTCEPLTPPLNHSEGVYWSEFSPDGKRIVTASWDKTARVWDAQTGQPLTPPMEHAGTVVFAQFSPDGRQIVTGSRDNTARLWDAQNGRPLTEPLPHSDCVNSAQFSPDGRRIVTAGGGARVWDARTGRPLTAPFKHPGWMSSAQFSPDGKRIATASSDGSARIWNGRGSQVGLLRHSGSVNSARYSPDGKRIVTASDDMTALIWDARTAQELTEPLRHSAPVESARFSPDGTRIVTASRDGTARVWDAQTGQPLTEPLQHSSWVYSAEFTADSSRVLTASADLTARIWDIAPSAATYPDWLVPLAQILSGQVVSRQGRIEPGTNNPVGVLNQVRLQLKGGRDDEAWTIWGRWLLADPSTRTISPFSKITVPEYIEDRIQENTAESLAQAEQLAYGNERLLQRISKARKGLNHTNLVEDVMNPSPSKAVSK